MQAIRISVRALTSVAALLLPVSAHAYWRGGIWVGVAPPLYPLPPPVYAVPPQVYAVPPPVYAVPPPYGYGGGYVAPPQYGYGGPPPAGGHVGQSARPRRTNPAMSDAASVGSRGRGSAARTAMARTHAQHGFARAQHAANDVRVGQFVDQSYVGATRQYGLEVHLLEFGPSIFARDPRYDLQITKLGDGERPTVGLHVANDDVSASFLASPSFVEHPKCLADTRRRTEVDPEVATLHRTSIP